MSSTGLRRRHGCPAHPGARPPQPGQADGRVQLGPADLHVQRGGLFQAPEVGRGQPDHRLAECSLVQRIDVLDCTPSQLRGWIDAGLLDHGDPAYPTLLLVGGEAIRDEPNFLTRAPRTASSTRVRFEFTSRISSPSALRLNPSWVWSNAM